MLAGITGASFLAWLPDMMMMMSATDSPGQDGATFLITDHKAYLDDVKNIREVLAESTAIEFEGMLRGEITPEQYIKSSYIASDQITMLIGEFVTSKPPEQWQKSYILYGEALRSLNMYIAETQAVATIMADGITLEDEPYTESERLRLESSEYALMSDAARPLQ